MARAFGPYRENRKGRWAFALGDCFGPMRPLCYLPYIPGDPDAAQRRMAALEGLDILTVTEEMIGLAEALIDKRLLPANAVEDALHIAIATLHQADFLLTWNCRHIANPMVQEGIAEFLVQKGLFLPIICTPEELLGGVEDE